MAAGMAEKRAMASMMLTLPPGRAVTQVRSEDSSASAGRLC